MNTQQLRQKILDLAIRGQLVPQDENDEPAQVLLEKIRAEKEKNLPKKGKPSSTSPYKNEEEFPFQIPENWAWCRLGEVCKFIGGYAFKSKDYQNVSKNQVIRIGNVKNDNLILNTQPVYISDELANLVDKFLIKENDLLFTMTGTKGKRDYFFTLVVPKINYNLYLNQRVGLLRVENKYININYINIVLKHSSVLDEIFKTETGNVNQGNIGSENTLKLKIPLPPLSEQHRIVSKIEEIFALIDTIEQNQSDLKTTIEQTKAKVLDMAIRGELLNDENHHLEISDNEHYTDEEFPFPIPKHWKWKKLGEIVSIGLGLTYTPNYVSKGIPFLSVSNLKENYIDLENVKYISEEDYRNASELSLPKKGDILFGRVGTLGKPKIVEFEEKYCTYVSLGTLKNKNINLTNTKFVKFWMESNLFWTQVNTNVKGSTLKNLNTNWLKDFLIPLPPLEEQQKIVQKIEKIFAELDFIEQNL